MAELPDLELADIHACLRFASQRLESAPPWNFPNSFWPHTYLPGRLHIEGRIASDSVAELSKRGHGMQSIDDWSPSMGALSGIVVDQESGTLKGGADPRRDVYAIGR